LPVKEESIKVKLKDVSMALSLFGPQDAYLKKIEAAALAKITVRGDELTITGDEQEVAILNQLFHVLFALLEKGAMLSERDILYALDMAKRGTVEELLELFDEQIALSAKGKPIRVKTLGQRHYITSIRKNDIVFGIGPAGTGKTYLAVVMAVVALKQGVVKRIVLTRPAVEAGENLGFLPGDLQEKVDPYLRPLYDALHDILGLETVTRYMERGTIEVAPLAYMRGRTLDDSFVILDEAQNTTPEQMKMFLTRLGLGSKMVITGDVTQIDLPKGKKSGLKDAEIILQRVSDISFVYLSELDVVRHPLVHKIIKAYAEAGENSK
jgi:phosphate starvation-inducible protein PhoH and related proteins